MADPGRRGGLRVAAVRIERVFTAIGGALVIEPARGIGHYVGFDRLVSYARRAELPRKLRAALAALDAEQLQLLAPAEKSAVNQMLAGAGAGELENAA